MTKVAEAGNALCEAAIKQMQLASVLEGGPLTRDSRLSISVGLVADLMAALADDGLANDMTRTMVEEVRARDSGGK